MEITLNVNRWACLKIAFVIFLLGVAFFAGAVTTVPTAYDKGFDEGYEVGYVKALTEVQGLLAEKGVDFEWQDLGDGRYILSVTVEGGLYARGEVTVDLWLEHRNAEGKLLSKSRGAGTLTTLGKNWIEQQLADTNATQKALHCGDSNDAGAPDVAWTTLPSEITSNGLERALGSYTSTGDGTWNVTKTKTASGTQSTQLWGLYYDTYASTENSLVAADSTPSQKNMESSDTLAETWQLTAS